MGYHPEIILAGRRINDGMGKFIADTTISELSKKNINIIDAKIAVCGITFKENCPDIRNAKVFSIINSLKKYKCSIDIFDKWASESELKLKYNINLKADFFKKI